MNVASGVMRRSGNGQRNRATSVYVSKIRLVPPWGDGERASRGAARHDGFPLRTTPALGSIIAACEGAASEHDPPCCVPCGSKRSWETDSLQLMGEMRN